MERRKEVYKVCMMIGYIFNQKYNNHQTSYWNASEECATIAKITYELIDTLNIEVEEALDYVMKTILKSGFHSLENHSWDEYTRGFLAGEILGMPTEINIAKAKEAEDIWENDHAVNYAYYQDVLEEVKSEKTLLYKLLKKHAGHQVEIVEYGDGINFSLEDIDTGEVIFDTDIYDLVGIV